MAKLTFNETSMIEANLREYESRTHSPMNRFLENTPIFVTYYHINNPESVSDVGFKDIQQILGKNSPLRFNKISKFPIYGIDQIVPNLQQTDYGADIDYSGQGIILPNTIDPLPNDFFMIDHLHSIYLFVITEIVYDTLRPDGYYQISFKLQYTDEEAYKDLHRQVIENNVCVLENIGTDKNSIIMDSDYDTIQNLVKMTSNMIDSYISMFYNQRHNCYISKINVYNRYYDQYMHTFIRRTKILDNSVNSIYSPIKIDDKLHDKKYAKSVWSWIEKGYDLSKIHTFPYDIHKAIDYLRSSFERYLEEDIVCNDMIYSNVLVTKHFFTNEYTNDIHNDHLDMYDIYSRTIGKFIRKDITKLVDIPNLEDIVLESDDVLMTYQYTPILLYFIKQAIEKKIKLVNTI